MTRRLPFAAPLAAASLALAAPASAAQAALAYPGVDRVVNLVPQS